MRTPIRMPLAPALALGAAIAALAAGVAAALDGDHAPHRGCRCAGAPAQASIAAQARLDAFVSVAKRIYRLEYDGTLVHATARRIAANQALLRALSGGRLAAARKLAGRPVLRHEVRVRVLRGSRVLVDVGLPFVVAGGQTDLRAADGSALGRLEVSIQDVIGFVRLVHRETGVQIVVRGGSGQLKTSLAAAARHPLPSSGPVTVAGRHYLVRSFAEPGFAGEQLTVWLLDRAR
jgi:hypothetical protein